MRSRPLTCCLQLYAAVRLKSLQTPDIEYNFITYESFLLNVKIEDRHHYRKFSSRPFGGLVDFKHSRGGLIREGALNKFLEKF